MKGVSGFVCKLAFVLFVVSSCKGMYDDTQIKQDISNLQRWKTELETALQNRDYIVSVSPYTEAGVQVGYQLNFAKSGSLIIYYGQDGANGQDGDSFFKSVAEDDNNVYLNLIDDTVIVIPKASGSNEMLAEFDPVYGVEFGTTEGDAAFKSALKSIWLEMADGSVTVPSPILLGRLANNNYETATVKCLVTFYDSDGTTIAYQFSRAAQQSGVQHLRMRRYGCESDAESPSFLHIIIDFDQLKNTRVISGLQTKVDVAKVHSQKVQPLKNAIYPLSGKKIVCFGDSITEFRGEDNMSYPEHLAILASATVINLGIGGTDLRERGTPVIDTQAGYQDSNYAALDIVNMIRAACGLNYDANTSYLQLAKTAAEWIRDNKPSGDDNTAQVAALAAIDWNTVDYVVIMGGTNDWHGGNSTKWGTPASISPSETFGAINYMIATFLSTYKHIKLLWATPTIRWIDYAGPDNPATVDSKFSDVYTYDGVTLKEFSADIYDLVKDNHIPVKDLYNELGWTKYNFSQYFNDNDGTHPRKGFKDIAVAILSMMGD